MTYRCSSICSVQHMVFNITGSYLVMEGVHVNMWSRYFKSSILDVVVSSFVLQIIWFVSSRYCPGSHEEHCVGDTRQLWKGLDSIYKHYCCYDPWNAWYYRNMSANTCRVGVVRAYLPMASISNTFCVTFMSYFLLIIIFFFCVCVLKRFTLQSVLRP